MEKQQRTDRELVEHYQRQLIARGVVPVQPQPWELDAGRGWLSYACSLLEQLEDLGS